MKRFNSTGLVPDDDWVNALNNGSFGRLTSSDDFRKWKLEPFDSEYDDFDTEYDDFDTEHEEPITDSRKDKSEAWRPNGIFVDPQEVGSRMDLPCQQHLYKLAEVQRTSALLAKVKETLDTVVRMADNSSHVETAAVKELQVAFRVAFGSADSDGPARKPKDREFINLQRLQDSESESDSDFDCLAEGKLMSAPPLPGPSSAARPYPSQLENAQTAFLNRLVDLGERTTEFTTEVDKMERRVDGKTEACGQEVIFCEEVKAPAAVPTMTGHKKKKKKKKKKIGVSPPVAAPWTPDTSWTSVTPWAPVSPTSSSPPITGGSWAIQPTPGPASNGQRTQMSQMFAATQAVPPSAAKKRKKSKGVARPQMLRPPKTAAVSLTAAAGRENEFGRAMARAMSTVKVDELGIDRIRPKRSVTGGLVLEIPGAEAHEKAAALKAGLEKALRGTGVRLSCPQKYAELRILGLTELATPKSIRKAVAAAGGCEKADVTVGDLRRENNGLFSAWARCPVRAAAKLIKDRQVTVHPFVAKVVALAQRPLQCHRCLEFGHVQLHCTSTVDRSNLCYRCGGTSHKAKGCLAAPRCPVCADLGVPANHRMGGPACNPPPRKMMTERLGSGVAPTQAMPAVLPPETPTTSRKRKRRARARGHASDVLPSSEPPEKISTVARAPLLATPKIFPSVAAVGAAPIRADLKASSLRACPVTNARTLKEMLSIALKQVAPGTSPSRTLAVVTEASGAKKLKMVDDGGAVNPSALVVQKDDPSTVVGANPSVDVAPDVSLSAAAADAAPGRVAQQVSPQEASPATNARITSDMLDLRQAAPETSPSESTAVITAAPEAKKLEVEVGEGAIKPLLLMVQKDDQATVAGAATSVVADPEGPLVFHH